MWFHFPGFRFAAPWAIVFVPYRDGRDGCGRGDMSPSRTARVVWGGTHILRCGLLDSIGYADYVAWFLDRGE